MQMRRIVASTVIAALAALSLANLSQQDRKFMMDAAKAGIFEVSVNQLALNKAKSAEVKQHARHMVNDHSKANAELKALARRKGLTLPTSMDRKHQSIVSKLRRLSGKAFDREHAKTQMKAHEDALKLFKKQAKSGSDPDVKAFAADKVMTIETHLGMWQRAWSEFVARR
jgi:putative membrane protein